MLQPSRSIITNVSLRLVHSGQGTIEYFAGKSLVGTKPKVHLGSKLLAELIKVKEAQEGGNHRRSDRAAVVRGFRARPRLRVGQAQRHDSSPAVNSRSPAIHNDGKVFFRYGCRASLNVQSMPSLAFRQQDLRPTRPGSAVTSRCARHIVIGEVPESTFVVDQPKGPPRCATGPPSSVGNREVMPSQSRIFFQPQPAAVAGSGWRLACPTL